MDKKIEFNLDKPLVDSFCIGISAEMKKEIALSIKDSVETPKALDIEIDATHCGYVNKNGYFYRHDGMAKSVISWIAPYGKPVITEHNDSTRPGGRITGSAFIPLPTISSSKSPSGRPTGKTRLRALVTDSEMVPAILDGRYLTVSTSGRPKDIPICSMCSQPVDKPGLIKKDKETTEECWHERRRIMEDGTISHWFVDEMEYSEVSFVNTPADQTPDHVAKVININVLTQVPNVGDAVVGDIHVDSNDNMIYDSIKKEDKRMDETMLKAFISSVLSILDDCPECDEGDKAGANFSEAELKELDELEKDYISAVYSIVDVVVPPVGSPERKSMNEKTFCGPNRTFPVADCKHAAVAMAMCDWPKVKAKYSTSVIAKIKACVRKKAKGMDCPMSKDSVTLSKFTEVAEKLVAVEKENTELKAKLDEMIKTMDALKIENEGLKKVIEDNKVEVEKIKQEDSEKITKDELDKRINEVKLQLDSANLKLAEMVDSMKNLLAETVADINITLKKEVALSVEGAKSAEDKISAYKVLVDEFKKKSNDELYKMISDLKIESSKKVLDLVSDPIAKSYKEIAGFRIPLDKVSEKSPTEKLWG